MKENKLIKISNFTDPVFCDGCNFLIKEQSLKDYKCAILNESFFAKIKNIVLSDKRCPLMEYLQNKRNP